MGGSGSLKASARLSEKLLSEHRQRERLQHEGLLKRVEIGKDGALLTDGAPSSPPPVTVVEEPKHHRAHEGGTRLSSDPDVLTHHDHRCESELLSAGPLFRQFFFHHHGLSRMIYLPASSM
jgi:hypothetical protein